MEHPEHKIQAEFFKMCEYIPECAWMFAVPNAMPGDVKSQVWMNREGRRKGVLDVFLSVPRFRLYHPLSEKREQGDEWHGLFIEFKKPHIGKSPAGKLTKEQANFIIYSDKMGYAVSVCYQAFEGVDAVKKYLQCEHKNESALTLAKARLGVK